MIQVLLKLESIAIPYALPFEITLHGFHRTQGGVIFHRSQHTKKLFTAQAVVKHTSVFAGGHICDWSVKWNVYTFAQIYTHTDNMSCQHAFCSPA